MAILKKRDGTIIAEDPNKTIKQLVEENYANLYHANLYYANLYHANLYHANLDCASLDYASLDYANLDHANLDQANLDHASLYHANLDCANLYYANLYHANLDHASLYHANLDRANLDCAKIEFHLFPSICLISSLSLGLLSPELSIELMHWDASMHPNPKAFDAWAEDGECPYQNEERLFFFKTRKEDWIIGEYTPKMNWVELCKAICKEKGWKIRGVKL